VHLVGVIKIIYHDARSPERQIQNFERVERRHVLHVGMLLFAACLYYYPFQSLLMFNSFHQIYKRVTLFVE